jgi:hypothetical protein
MRPYLLEAVVISSLRCGAITQLCGVCGGVGAVDGMGGFLRASGGISDEFVPPALYGVKVY